MISPSNMSTNSAILVWYVLYSSFGIQSPSSLRVPRASHRKFTALRTPVVFRTVKQQHFERFFYFIFRKWERAFIATEASPEDKFFLCSGFGASLLAFLDGSVLDGCWVGVRSVSVGTWMRCLRYMSSWDFANISSRFFVRPASRAFVHAPAQKPYVRQV